MRNPRRPLVLLCTALTLGATGIAAGPSPQAVASGYTATSRHVAEVAPYFEATDDNTSNLHAAVSNHGLKSFTAAFVLGKGCTPAWDDYSTITGTDARSAAVRKAKSAGATPILSFGGQQGNDLAKTCTSVSRLVRTYQGLMTMFGVTKLDFDVEGAGPLEDTAANTRRFQALKVLKKQHPNLEISFTLPASQTGIATDPDYGNGVALLKLAKAQGVRVDVVNLMAMDYGSPVKNMGTVAIAVARGALAQIRKIWPASTWANIGITPMIGKNDSAGETFTYSNAQAVVAFARAHGVRRLAFWSLNRDQACTSADRTCSGLTQSRLDYTDAFVA